MKNPWYKRTASDFNEFYTLYEEADKFLTPYLKFIEGKKVYCPCDSENSNIVKWLKDHNIDVNYQYEKDFNSDEVRAEMLKYDVIITNPPFSAKQFKPFVQWILDNNKDCIIWGLNNDCFYNELYYYDFQRSNMHPYLRPDGTIKYAMSKLRSTFKVELPFSRKKDYDITYMPYTAVWYYDKDKYTGLGRVKQRNPKDYARCALARKEGTK